MIQLNFLNAVVEDTGYGMRVNGKRLEEIISLAVGAIKEIHDPNGSTWTDLKKGEPFSSRLCNVSVTIDDRSHEKTETIIFHGEDNRIEEVDLETYRKSAEENNGNAEEDEERSSQE